MDLSELAFAVGGSQALARPALPVSCCVLHPAAMVMHLYQVVGRHLPVEKKDGSVDNNQKIFRMKVFAEDEVRIRAAFRRFRRATGRAFRGAERQQGATGRAGRRRWRRPRRGTVEDNTSAVVLHSSASPRQPKPSYSSSTTRTLLPLALLIHQSIHQSIDQSSVFNPRSARS